MSESAPSTNFVGPASPSPASLSEVRDDHLIVSNTSSTTGNGVGSNANSGNSNNSVSSGGTGIGGGQSSIPKPSRLTEKDYACIPSETCKLLRAQDNYITCLEERLSCLEGELANVRDGEERLRAQHVESQQREKVLVRRLAAKEQEMQDVAAQMAELKSNQSASPSGLRSALLDPAVNILLQRLRHELITSRTRLDETQNELSAWKFTPDSNTGKRLMAKCRLLYTENEELGKLTNSGRVAKLEGELALQKSFSEEVKKSQSELDEFLQDLDEDVEGMQSTIYYLQQELRKTKDTVVSMERELSALRNTNTSTTNNTSDLHNSNSNNSNNVNSNKNSNSNNNEQSNALNNNNITQQHQQQQQQQLQQQQKLNGNCKSDCDRTTTHSLDSDSEPELIIKVSDKEMYCDDDSRDGHITTPATTNTVKQSDDSEVVETGAVGGSGDGDGTNSVGDGVNCTLNGDAKRTYDSDSSETHINKKVRRSSVLSLEYNEDNMDDDALIISTNGDGTISDAD